MDSLPKAGPVPVQQREYDLAEAFRIEDFWPDISDVPQWPLFQSEQSRAMNPPYTRQDAVNRLERIRYILNGGRTNLRAPTDEEAQRAFAAYFIQGPAIFWRWNRIPGFDNLRPAPGTGDAADLMVESLHIRAWLRKLDERIDRTLDARKAHEKGDRSYIDRQMAHQALATFKDKAPQAKAELATLEEAEARHKQRLADAQAFARAQKLRGSLEAMTEAAQKGARVLKVELPEI